MLGVPAIGIWNCESLGVVSLILAMLILSLSVKISMEFQVRALCCLSNIAVVSCHMGMYLMLVSVHVVTYKGELPYPYAVSQKEVTNSVCPCSCDLNNVL